jgi:hypothetical protein
MARTRTATLRIAHQCATQLTRSAEEQSMKAYVITTGSIFALLVVAHIFRIVQERQLATEPWFLLLTMLSAALAVWALLLIRTANRNR